MSSLEPIVPLQPRSSQFLNGKTVRIFGPLQSMSIREATKLIREHGGCVRPPAPTSAHSTSSSAPPSSASSLAPSLDPSLASESSLTSANESGKTDSGWVLQDVPPVDWIIIGERQHVFTDSCSSEVPAWLTDQLREDIECGLTHIATETQLLQRLFPSEDQSRELTALYTPVMLAELLKVTVADVRRWYQRGLIAPVRVIKRLPYFNLEEVFSARRLSMLLQNGVRHPSIEKKLKALRSLNPGVLPLLAGNELVIQGKNVFLRQNDHLVESTGQLLLDFEAIEDEKEEAQERLETEVPESLRCAPGRVEDLTNFDSARSLGNLRSFFGDKFGESEENEKFGKNSENVENTKPENEEEYGDFDLWSEYGPLDPVDLESDAQRNSGLNFETDSNFAAESELERGSSAGGGSPHTEESVEWRPKTNFLRNEKLVLHSFGASSPRSENPANEKFSDGNLSGENLSDENLPEDRISISRMRALALALDEAGKLEEATEMYRNILFAAGANAEDTFQLGDLLHRLDHLEGARERFSMAIELDEDFVEARASLGCVLGELGEVQLAISALEGAISYHSDYAEAYYHLARFLEMDGQKKAACRCYQKFLELTDSRDSFWSREATARIRELSADD